MAAGGAGSTNRERSWNADHIRSGGWRCWLSLFSAGLGDEMNKERSYFDRPYPFDPELQSDTDIEAIIRASREKPPTSERKPK
jgi:hypothetical protein